MIKRAFVNCKRYNNSEDVKFIMELNDFRLNDGNYDQLDTVTVVKNSFTSNGKTYKVFSDWSVAEV